MTPTNPSIANGLTEQFTATGTYTDNSTQNLTTQVTWASRQHQCGHDQQCRWLAGTGELCGGGQHARSPPPVAASRAAPTLTVTSATLVSIAVTPANPSIANGLTEQFTATGTYTDNSTQNLTTQVTWASSDTGVATISNAGGSQGLASSAAAGSTTISATSGSISGSTTLTVTPTYSIGGSITGLSQSALMLTDNGGNATSISSGASSFTFSTQLAYGASYAVAVSTQPTGQTCTVSNGSGTVSGTVTSVSISCTTNTYTVGGSISGLSQSGLVLTDNGGNPLSVNSGATSFTFSNQLSYGSSYAVAVSTQPTGQTCTVSSGSGTVAGTVTSVSVSCTTNTYTIGGSITGLTASGLVLADNGGNPLPVSSGSTSFTFSTQLSYGASYAVAVSTQPSGQLCTVSNGSGTVTGTVTSVTLSCVTSYTIGGTISGLTMSSVVLANGSATVTVSAGSSSWVFASSFATGSSYSVSVQTQPAGETCQVTSGGSGTLSANVSNVTVACALGCGPGKGARAGPTPMVSMVPRALLQVPMRRERARELSPGSTPTATCGCLVGWLWRVRRFWKPQ